MGNIVNYPKKANELNRNSNILDEHEEFEIEGLETDLEDEINASIFTDQEYFETSFISKHILHLTWENLRN